MVKPDPALSRYLFESANLVPEAFHVVSFQGEEEISRLFRYEIELLSEDPYLDFSKIINEPATFFIKRDEELLPVAGIVIDFEQAGRNLDSDYTQYRAVLVPKLWRLTLNFQSRIFQHLSVPDIIKEVLNEAGFSGADYTFELGGDYEKREYCVQYQETDLNFIQRLMEYEGLSYFFKHDKNKEKIVITDKQDAFKLIEGKAEVAYVYRSEDPEKEKIDVFICKEKLVSSEFILNDYNYRDPDANLRVDSKINSKLPGTTYIYGQHYKDAGSGKRLVRVRNEEMESTRRVLHGRSDCAGLQAGYRFGLIKHYRSDYNEEYLVTRVEHQGTHRYIKSLVYQGATEEQQKEEDKEKEPEYQNTFTCLLAKTTYRPPRATPVPKIHGIMTATVIGDSNYAALDDQGRYQANMHFDLDKEGSRPIRMAQPYTGKDNAGFHLPPHPGTEMVWSAIDGDPDRPFAIASGPNPNNDAPVIDANNSQHVFRTTSKNLYVIEDAHGKERITHFTPHAMTSVSLGASHRSVTGASISTDETIGAYAKKGIALHGETDGVRVVAGDKFNAPFSPAVMAAVETAVVALVGKIKSEFIDAPSSAPKIINSLNRIKSLLSTASGVLNNAATKEIAQALGLEEALEDVTHELAGVDEFFNGSNEKGVNVFAKGSVDIYAHKTFEVTSFNGNNLQTAGATNIHSADSIVMATLASIGQYAKTGDIQSVTNEGNIYFKAVDKHIVSRAKKNIISSAGNAIYLKAGDVTDDLKRKTLGSVGKKIIGDFTKKDTKEDTEYKLPPEDSDGRIQLNAKDGVFINGEDGPVIIQSDDKDVAVAGKTVAIGGENGVEIYDDTKQVHLECGKSTITLKHDGTIDFKGINIIITADQNVTIDGLNVKSTGDLENAMISKAMCKIDGGPMTTVKGGLVKIN